MRALVLALCTALAAADPILLRPVSYNVSFPDVGFIWIQGADCHAEAYGPIAVVIQQAFPKHNVWFAVPDEPLHFPDPLTIASAIEGSYTRMQTAGLSPDAPMFCGAHSLGGLVLQDYVAKQHTRLSTGEAVSPAFRGMILTGSFLARSFNASGFPIPTLTVAGELDGLARVFRQAEAWYYQVLHNPRRPVRADALRDYPVALLRGVTHNQFASGPPPPNVKAHDLKPEVTYAAAHAAVAAVVAPWVRLQLGTPAPQDAAVLAASHESTAAFFAPILDALRLEGFYHFIPPCYCQQAGIGHIVYEPCPRQPSCNAGNPWTEATSQAVMAGTLPSGVTLSSRDSFRPVDSVDPIHLPKVFNTCDNHSAPACTLHAATVSQNVYAWLDAFDTGESQVSAIEIRTKLVSRQQIQSAARPAKPAPNFTSTDVVTSPCREINQRAIAWAEQHASAATWERYRRIGQALFAGEDDVRQAGPWWIYRSMEYRPQPNGTMEVVSVSAYAPMDYPIAVSCCIHYCKVLSPAAALEWMYIDGLRLRGSIAGTADPPRIEQYRSARRPTS
eukprot:TRINITY_DN34058_c0_g1_i1.p1 TRINITY_DN34058_c0_g1~~TRINITY_DN34058_c0_g1_i1.p1  ORF type:complete len:559 (+),score=92.83 TRINITY_DN34058_c0_g1_i1:109-1785(+)